MTAFVTGLWNYFTHPTNDYELAIVSSKKLEFVLDSEFNARGKGLHEKITSCQNQLPGSLIRDMRQLATIRNKLIHEKDFNNIPDRPHFIERYEKSVAELRTIIAKKHGTSSWIGDCAIM